MNRTIGSNIRTVREAKKITLEKLADMTGFAMDHLGRIEREETKNPRINTLEKIAKALNINVHDLIPPSEKMS